MPNDQLLKIEVIEHLFIQLPDGCKLAAKIWLPADAAKNPVPAILEYLPYRKRDGTAWRDQITHPYIAERGYACIRVDMRGSGESDGILKDEYLLQEQEDCLFVISWIAKQQWCTGNVGMMGISWGGFNSLQVAARQPPELKAIISLCSTDDRYNDDIHYKGGCLLNDNFQWSSVMLAMMSRAPDPVLLGKDWSKIWLNRLNKQSLLAITWLKHQRRDKFWQHGSIAKDYSAIKCPVYLVGGWADGYARTIPRMLSNLQCPRKGLIGPWAHKYPHFAKPGPQIGFLQEALRWWDYWLKGKNTAIMDEPMYRVWMQDSVRPKPYYDIRPGRWIAEESWPSKNIQNKILFFNAKGLLGDKKTIDEEEFHGCSPQTVGETAGAWCGYGLGPEKPLDQRIDDARSICFETNALSEPLEILGAPVIELDLVVDQPEAFIAVRLNEVSPEGESTRISYGLLNLTLRDSQEKLKPIIPGERMHVRLQLNDCAHAFSAGNKIRIAISTTYWPLVWPSPKPIKLCVFTNSSLLLPTRAPRNEDKLLKDFQDADGAPPLSVTYIRPALGERKINRNLNGLVSYYVKEDFGHSIMNDIKLHTDYVQEEIYSIRDDDPLSAEITIETDIALGRGDWQTRTKMKSSMTATETHYELKATLMAYQSEQLVVKREWNAKIPRDKLITTPTQTLSQFFKSKILDNKYLEGLPFKAKL